MFAACHLETLPPPSALSEQHNVSVPESALRMKVRALVAPYVGAIEGAANEVARRCPETPVRANALSWKLQAVPAAQDALLQPDPLLSLLDFWAYTAQMRNVLASPRGEAALGACSDGARRAMARLADQAREVAVSVSPRDAQRANELVEKWASQHPLAALDSPRATMAEALATTSARKELGALAAVGTIVETLDDLSVRIAAYRETLLKEATWTAELAALQAGGSDLAQRALEDAGRMAKAVDRMGALMERMPALIERERKAALLAVREERVAVLADVDRQRVETLAAVQRAAEGAFERMDGLARGTIDQGAARADGLVDRVFLRAAEMILVLAALGVLAFILATKVFHLPIRRERHP
jgi:hypothetical protein